MFTVIITDSTLTYRVLSVSLLQKSGGLQMGRLKEPFRVYAQKRHWITKDGKTHNGVSYRIRYWAGNVLKTMPTGKKKKSDALAYAFELARQGKFNMTPTFRDFATGFYDRPENVRGLKPGTQYRKTKSLNKPLLEWFGDYTLAELTTTFFENFFQKKVDEGETAKGTAINHIATLSQVFEDAVKRGHLVSNPMKGITVQGPDSEKEAFTLDEVNALLTDTYPWSETLSYYACLISAVTGLRIGEIQALQKKHIRFDQRQGVVVIHVEQSYSPIGKKPGKTKTPAGERFVPVVGAAASWLKGRAILKRPAENGNPPEFQDQDYYIFSSTGGVDGIIGQGTISYALNKYYEKKVGAEKPRTKTFHSFRHFFNSRMLILTAHNDALVKAVMGHGDKNNMTLTYMTTTPDKFLSLVEPMRKILGTVKTLILPSGEEIEVPDDKNTTDFGAIGPDNY